MYWNYIGCQLETLVILLRGLVETSIKFKDWKWIILMVQEIHGKSFPSPLPYISKITTFTSTMFLAKVLGIFLSFKRAIDLWWDISPQTKKKFIFKQIPKYLCKILEKDIHFITILRLLVNTIYICVQRGNGLLLNT